MSFNEKMTAIANETRSLVGSTDLLGLDDIAQNLGDANAEVDTQMYLLQQVLDKINNLPEAGSGGGSEGGDYPVLSVCNNTSHDFTINGFFCNRSETSSIPFGDSGMPLVCMLGSGSDLDTLRYSYTEGWEGDDGEWIEEEFSGLIQFAETDYSYGIKIGICMDYPWNGETFYIEEVEE